MPLETFLTHEEKNSIKIYKENGYSNREIARKINRSNRVVRNFSKKGFSYGIRRKTKGNTKL